MSNYPYDRSFDPPAPVVEVILGAPGIVPDRGVRALLDSGADQTTIPERVAIELGLAHLDEIDVFGIEQEAFRSRVYLVSAKIRELPTIELEVLSWTGTYALIGRDLLNRVHIILDGPQLQLTLEGAAS